MPGRRPCESSRATQSLTDRLGVGPSRLELEAIGVNDHDDPTFDPQLVDDLAGRLFTSEIDVDPRRTAGIFSPLPRITWRTRFLFVGRGDRRPGREPEP